MSPAPLEARVRRLELQSRALGMFAVSALVLFVLAARAPREEVVAAERFELVDADGRVRAEIAIDADGSAGFFVRDAEGRVRATLIQDDAQSALYLMDETGTIRVGAAQYAHGGGGLALHGADSKGAAVLYMKDAVGTLTFHDAEGEVVERVPGAGR